MAPAYSIDTDPTAIALYGNPPGVRHRVWRWRAHLYRSAGYTVYPSRSLPDLIRPRVFKKLAVILEENWSHAVDRQQAGWWR